MSPLNAHSVPNNVHMLRLLLRTRRCDLILSNETWLTDDASDIGIAIFGYNAFRKERLSKRGGGCLRYTRDTPSASWFNRPKFNKLKDSKRLTLATGRQDLLVCRIYRPLVGISQELLPLIDAINATAELAAPKLVAATSLRLGFVGLLFYPRPTSPRLFPVYDQAGGYSTFHYGKESAVFLI